MYMVTLLVEDEMEALFLMNFWNHQWCIYLTSLNKSCSCPEVRFFLLEKNSMHQRPHMVVWMVHSEWQSWDLGTILWWGRRSFLTHSVFNAFSFLDIMVLWWSEVVQSCLTLCDPVDYSPPGSSVHGILQARILEWVAISFSRGSSWPRDQTQVSRIAGRRFNLWATRVVL